MSKQANQYQGPAPPEWLPHVVRNPEEEAAFRQFQAESNQKNNNNNNNNKKKKNQSQSSKEDGLASSLANLSVSSSSSSSSTTPSPLPTTEHVEFDEMLLSYDPTNPMELQLRTRRMLHQRILRFVAARSPFLHENTTTGTTHDVMKAILENMVRRKLHVRDHILIVPAAHYENLKCVEVNGLAVFVEQEDDNPDRYGGGTGTRWLLLRHKCLHVANTKVKFITTDPKGNLRTGDDNNDGIQKGDTLRLTYQSDLLFDPFIA